MIDADDEITSLAQRRTRTFKPGPLILVATTPKGVTTWPSPGTRAPKHYSFWQVKKCLQCGAEVAVDPAGNIAEGGMPCGH